MIDQSSVICEREIQVDDRRPAHLRLAIDKVAEDSAFVSLDDVLSQLSNCGWVVEIFGSEVIYELLGFILSGLCDKANGKDRPFTFSKTSTSSDRVTLFSCVY